MIRFVASATVLAGCLFAAGCDTSAGTGTIGPSVTVTRDSSSGSKDVGKQKIGFNPPGSPGADGK